MGRALAPHLAPDQPKQLRVTRPVAQRPAQVGLALGEQAVADLTVRGEPRPVAGGAEGVGLSTIKAFVIAAASILILDYVLWNFLIGM